MRHAAPTRKELGVRTAFNLLGPLTNPAGASRQLVGVPRPELTELVARSLGQLGSERAWVVHGADGLDEISTTGYTKVSECRDGAVNTFYLHPVGRRLPQGARPRSCAAATPADNARIARDVLAGRDGAPRDIVLLNAGASLLIAGRGPDADGRHRAWPPRRSTAARGRDVLADAGAPLQSRPGGSRRVTDAPDLLDTIVAATRRAVEVREAAAAAGDADERAAARRAGGDALRGGAAAPAPVPRIIAECKRRSPSQGHPARRTTTRRRTPRRTRPPARRRSRC